jgi:hypothetical protein
MIELSQIDGHRTLKRACAAAALHIPSDKACISAYYNLLTMMFMIFILGQVPSS